VTSDQVTKLLSDQVTSEQVTSEKDDDNIIEATIENGKFAE
jgi:hypothetical protein